MSRIWYKLNNNNKKKNTKIFLNLWFIKMTPSHRYHCFTDTLNFFHQNLKIILPSFPERVAQTWAALVGCLGLSLKSSSSHTRSVAFKSADCVGQDISWRTSCPSLILTSLWLSLQVCFGSLSCMRTNLWQPTNRVPDGVAWCCSMLG